MNAYKISAALLLGVAFAGAEALAQPATVSAPPAPNEVVYTAQLPTPASLATSAQASGATIATIDQMPNEELVVYRYTNGQTSTVAYRMLANASDAAVVAAPNSPPPSTVVYQDADSYPYGYYDAYPWGWWGPGAYLGLGYGGYGYGGFHGGYRGGFHGGGFHGGGFGGGFHGGGFHGGGSHGGGGRR